jgi:hypothetical protein
VFYSALIFVEYCSEDKLNGHIRFSERRKWHFRVSNFKPSLNPLARRVFDYATVRVLAGSACVQNLPSGVQNLPSGVQNLPSGVQHLPSGAKFSYRLDWKLCSAQRSSRLAYAHRRSSMQIFRAQAKIHVRKILFSRVSSAHLACERY